MGDVNFEGRVGAIRRMEAEYIARRAQARAVIEAHNLLGKPLADRVPVVSSLAETIRTRLEDDATANAGRSPEVVSKGRLEKAISFGGGQIIVTDQIIVTPRHSHKLHGVE